MKKIFKNHFFVSARLVLILVMLLVSAKGFAESALRQEMKQDEEASQKAKLRQFPGGKDEADLVVQPELITPKRKIKPENDKSVEAQEPAAADD